MVSAGAIPLLVSVLSSKSDQAREHATAVVSALARQQGHNKRAIYVAGGIVPLVENLRDAKPATQRHAACALWGLSDGKDGTYDKQIAEAGAIPSLITMLQYDDPETRGFAAACLLCLCKDPSSRSTILESGGTEPLQALCYGPATWLRGQVVEMLTLLGVAVPDPESIPSHLPMPKSMMSTGDSPPGSPTATARSGGHSGRYSPHTARYGGFNPAVPLQSARPLSSTARMKFHFFSFQIHGTTGYAGHA